MLAGENCPEQSLTKHILENYTRTGRPVANPQPPLNITVKFVLQELLSLVGISLMWVLSIPHQMSVLSSRCWFHFALSFQKEVKQIITVYGWVDMVNSVKRDCWDPTSFYFGILRCVWQASIASLPGGPVEAGNSRDASSFGWLFHGWVFSKKIPCSIASGVGMVGHFLTLYCDEHFRKNKCFGQVFLAV